jgi:methylated-DNA-[protein]-cysteine S-methyltransferase
MSENGQQQSTKTAIFPSTRISMTHHFQFLSSPVGRLTLVANDHSLAAILWENDNPKQVPLGPLTENSGHAVLRETAHQLGEYFSGQRRTFSLPFDPIGTAFQKTVWAALGAVPFGETRSYAEIARAVGRPEAVRAVGAANGRNPLSIVVPCHRVIGAGGKLTGFAGGLAAKAYLLNLESKAVSGRA